MPLPDKVPWWEVFSCRTDQIVEVACTLHALYARPKAKYVSLDPEAVPGAAGKPAASEPGGGGGASPAVPSTVANSALPVRGLPPRHSASLACMAF